LRPKRLGKPVAFGGKYITLTDALNCVNFEIGDFEKSRKAWNEKFGSLERAKEVVEKYISVLCNVIESFGKKTVVGTGYLAKFLIPLVKKRLGIKAVVPEHHEAANAVGVAISKISLTLYARYDTEKGLTIYNGNVLKCEFKKKSVPDDEEIIEVAVRKVKEIAKEFGAENEDLDKVEVIYFNSYTVVRGGWKRGKIADVVVQIEPGISRKFLRKRL